MCLLLPTLLIPKGKRVSLSESLGFHHHRPKMPCRQALLCNSCFRGPNFTVDIAKYKASGDARRSRTFSLTEAPTVSLTLQKCHFHPPAASNSLTRGRQRLSLPQTIRARTLAPKKPWKSSLLKEVRPPPRVGWGTRGQGDGGGRALMEEPEAAKTSALQT